MKKRSNLTYKKIKPMAKDKPAKRISLKEHIANKAENTQTTKTQENEFTQLNDVFSEETNLKLIGYNETINTLDEKYTTLIPRFDVLVRAFVNPMKVIDGVILPNSIPVKAPTQSGVSIVGTMDNPFPYAKKAVVVALPNNSEHTGLSVGDIVYLNDSPVTAKAVGKGDNAVAMIPNSFVHPENADKYPLEAPIPTDPSSEDYGYLLVKPFDIKIIITKHGK